MTLLVKPKHCHQVGYCMRQVRPWLEVNGFSVRDFVHNGIPVEDLEATGDQLAIRICEHVKAQEAVRGEG